MLAALLLVAYNRPYASALVDGVSPRVLTEVTTCAATSEPLLFATKCLLVAAVAALVALAVLRERRSARTDHV